MGPILGYFNTVSVCLFMMSKSISAETSPLHNVNCPNMLPSISLGIDGQHFHGTKFTTSSTSGKKFLVFPKIPCAYYVDTKRIKYHFKDIIPAFNYLNQTDSHNVLRSIANDISHFGNNCQRNSGTTSKDFLGIQIIQLRPTDFWKKSHFSSGVKDEIFKVFESKQVDLFDADFLDVLGEPWEKNARIETILGFLRFKCSGSDVMFVETKSLVTFYRTVRRNILLVYVYGGRVRRVRLMNQ